MSDHPYYPDGDPRDSALLQPGPSGLNILIVDAATGAEEHVYVGPNDYLIITTRGVSVTNTLTYSSGTSIVTIKREPTPLGELDGQPITTTGQAFMAHDNGPFSLVPSIQLSNLRDQIERLSGYMCQMVPSEQGFQICPDCGGLPTREYCPLQRPIQTLESEQ